MAETPSSPRHFNYIDALRGYAILMVIAVHTAQAFPDLPGWLAQILTQGARGVQLFFVTSALTLSMSWVARNETTTDFYIRRLFRIAPMFWIAIIFFLWLNGTAPSAYGPFGIGFKHIAMTALLVQGFWPDTITSVVPGGWSVADEVIFYALFPAIVPSLLKASWRSFIIVAVAAVVFGPRLSGLFEFGFSYFFPGSESLAGIYFSLWWFPRQLPCFIFGVMLFRFSAEGRTIPPALPRYACVLAVALMLFIPFLDGVKYVLPLGLVTTYGIVFSLFAFSLMHWPNSPLIGRPIEWIGKVSYSAYFIHFVILRFLPPLLPSTGWPVADLAYMFSIQVLVTVGFSSLTYLMIEKPMIRFGSALIAGRQSRSKPLPLDLLPEGKSNS
jgi:peptidoglycan/LPS O-acetylase OafA/YrhL